ncbi:MAG: DUF11 domain-containing protein [Oscillospiraceae bacterium]|nr:DUF11 domain-containing protein [Oscillospiraceae bacterium]
MAIFTNQATLTYNGSSTNSNIAYGEILDVLVATKTAVEGSYTPGQLVTYVVTLRNTGNVPLTGLVVTDNLGGYDFNGTTVYPLTYEDGTVALFTDGIPQTAPTVTAGPPLVFSNITVPAGGDAVIIYQARANAYANPAVGGTIDNTVTISGDGLSAPITATETVVANAEPMLTISKSITPAQVVDNDRVTYTFVIQNSGNQAVVATDDAVITDTFNPILTALAVTFNGVPWTQGAQYNYNEATGLFSTVPGQILVPAATYAQDPVTGAYTATPGIATLIVTGTI